MTGGLLIELLKHSTAGFFGLPTATLANFFGGHIPISMMEQLIYKLQDWEFQYNTSDFFYFRLH
jgi:hypothetical protein